MTSEVSDCATFGRDQRWLPVEFGLVPHDVQVTWLAFESIQSLKPFLHDSIHDAYLRSPNKQITSLRTLFRISDQFDPLPPTAFIFHVSRCGSTLLMRGLQLGERVVVLGEPPPVGFWLDPSLVWDAKFERLRIEAILSVCKLYGHQFGGRNAKVVVKAFPSNLLEIGAFRRMFPAVPMVIVIREPIEVIVSNLIQPSCWFGLKAFPEKVAIALGLSESQVARMPVEEYAARFLGKLFECASVGLKIGPSLIVDYNHLDAGRLRQIADFIGLQIPPHQLLKLGELFRLYSKDTERSIQFASDTTKKWNLATDTVQFAVDRWTRSQYQLLLEQSI